MSSSKLEIRSKMAEVQKEYSQLAAELKELEETEKKTVNVERFKEFQHKIMVKGTFMDKEPTVYPVQDEDRMSAYHGRLFAVTGSNKDGSTFIMLKSLDELPRIQLMFSRLHAAERIHDKEEKDFDKYVKILLGEPE